MKYLLIPLFYVLNLVFINAQIPNLVWAKGMGGTNYDYSYGIAVDVNGNVYTIGTFADTADFDPGVGQYNLTSKGKDDIFISKLDPNGNLVWAKSIGGQEEDLGISITVDDKGNIYATGSYSGTVDFDPGSGVKSLSSTGDYDIFILKLDNDGNFIWAKSIGGISTDQGNSITSDTVGNIYVAGLFKETLDFIPTNGVKSITSNGGFDIFILKLDQFGNLEWAKNMGGINDDSAFWIAVDATGNVYTTGTFNGKADFNPGNEVFDLSSLGYEDVFINKLDSSGNFIWAKSIGGPNRDQANWLNIDNSGNVYITGGFLNKVDFDPGPNTSYLISSGDYDIFILKLDANGTFLWAKDIGGSLDEQGNSVVLDSEGNIYIAGEFSGSVDFDPGPLTSKLFSSGMLDIYITKLDSLGNFKWAVKMGGGADDYGYALAIDKSDNLYTTGVYSLTANFDPGSGTFNLTSLGSTDVYITKLSQSSVATKESISDNKFSIYPNPTTGLLNIHISDPSKEIRIEIYNMLGVLVYKQTEVSEINSMDLNNQANGLYIIKLIVDSNKTATRTFIKTE